MFEGSRNGAETGKLMFENQKLSFSLLSDRITQGLSFRRNDARTIFQDFVVHHGRPGVDAPPHITMVSEILVIIRVKVILAAVNLSFLQCFKYSK